MHLAVHCIVPNLYIFREKAVELKQVNFVSSLKILFCDLVVCRSCNKATQPVIVKFACCLHQKMQKVASKNEFVNLL